MVKAFETIVLLIATLFCLFTTWSSATEPGKFAAQLGLSISNAGGDNEIRAQYSGFFLAVALACAASLAGRLPRQCGLFVLVVVFGGLLVGRIAALFLNGGAAGYGPTIRALCVIDCIGLALSLSAMIADRYVST